MTSFVDKSCQGLSATGFHRIAYREWGTGARTIVCVHGLTRNGRDFDILAADLADRLGARVVCPDIVGRGGSGRLANPDNYGYPQYLADMAVLLARLDTEQVDWVGTSMGGLIGMMLAAQPNSPIGRLVINDVGPFIPRQALERIGDYVGQDPFFADMDGVEAYFRSHYAGFGALTDAQWRRMAETSSDAQPGGGFRLAYDPDIARIFKNSAVTDVDLWPVWAAIRQPVLVVRGAQSDLLLADTAERMTKEGPRASLYLVPDAGHAPALLADDQVTAVRNFLAHD
ncbi:alpha/beta fold hydrolase [Niveispirillum fermenti]|uniref:alpha/beta fold hydrolase n=1 Tax=Niveispirillum fermenti TaxID=1233113 RepID=UPI003A8A09D5